SRPAYSRGNPSSCAALARGRCAPSGRAWAATPRRAPRPPFPPGGWCASSQANHSSRPSREPLPPGGRAPPPGAAGGAEAAGGLPCSRSRTAHPIGREQTMVAGAMGQSRHLRQTPTPAIVGVDTGLPREGDTHSRQDKLEIIENEGILHEVKNVPCCLQEKYPCSCP